MEGGERMMEGGWKEDEEKKKKRCDEQHSRKYVSEGRNGRNKTRWPGECPPGKALK